MGNLRQHPHTVVWRPAPSGTVKINFDVAINNQKGYIGVWLIARDHMGIFLGAQSPVHKLKVDAKTAESIAALGAVLFSKEASFLDVNFEGDALQVVTEINSDPPSSLAPAISQRADIRKNLGYGLVNFFTLTRRRIQWPIVLPKKLSVIKLMCFGWRIFL
jgi:hypothetical protein